MRIGLGYDVHRLIKGRKLILGGVTIPYEKGLLGHSDADVVVHAVIDALLGAAALGDIGKHFPDTSPDYENICSIDLLIRTNTMIIERGFKLINLDTTIFAEVPKLAPYKSQMEKNLAAALKSPFECINIKATTAEGLGEIGRKEAISAMGIVLLEDVD
jgi:2-C-methyl-D-erythritol 2,4-cyclodiphosphate synthase